jgi:hypothetical protein
MMSLTVDQAKNKTDVFNEIKTTRARTTGGMQRYWREDWFDFSPLKQNFVDRLKDKKKTLDLKLEYVGDRVTKDGIAVQQKGKFKVMVSGDGTEGPISTGVGIIQEDFK